MADIDWGLLTQLSLPLLILLGTALFLIVLAPFLSTSLNFLPTWISLVALGASFFFAWLIWRDLLPLKINMLVFDRVAYSFDLLVLASGLLTTLLMHEDLSRDGTRETEASALFLMAIFGAMLIAHAGDLIVLFLGLEILSLAAYVLAGLRRVGIKSGEASLKYFVLGAFASGFLLYGIAMAYGATGSTSFADLQNLSIPPAEGSLVFLSVALLLIGVGFKIAAVPFHFWTPDVYEGAPTSVTAFMASAIKTAAFMVLLRIILALGHLPQIPWVTLLWWLAALTMTVGNLAALYQSNLKRMLAYSSIAHAGYALVGVAAALQKNALTESTLAAVIFYLFAYSVTTIGAFAIVIAIRQKSEGERDEISDLSTLAERHPGLALSLSLFLLSLMGIPPTIGFIGKFYVFAGAVEAGLYGLVIVGVLNSVVSAYYYLSPVVRMYFQRGDETGVDAPRLLPLSYPLMVGIFICFFLVVYVGIFSSGVFLLARESVRELVF